jgi:hypothetical protein
LQAEHIADLAGRKEINLDARRRDADAIDRVQVGKAGLHALGEPVLDQLVDDDQVLGVKNDAGRVAVVEADQLALLETYG